MAIAATLTAFIIPPLASPCGNTPVLNHNLHTLAVADSSSFVPGAVNIGSRAGILRAILACHQTSRTGDVQTHLLLLASRRVQAVTAVDTLRVIARPHALAIGIAPVGLRMTVDALGLTLGGVLAGGVSVASGLVGDVLTLLTAQVGIAIPLAHCSLGGTVGAGRVGNAALAANALSAIVHTLRVSVADSWGCGRVVLDMTQHLTALISAIVSAQPNLDNALGASQLRAFLFAHATVHIVHASRGILATGLGEALGRALIVAASGRPRPLASGVISTLILR